MWAPKERRGLTTSQLVSRKKVKRKVEKRKPPLQHPPSVAVRRKPPPPSRPNMKEFLNRVSLVYAVMRRSSPVLKTETMEGPTPSEAKPVYELVRYLDIDNEFYKVTFKWLRNGDGHSLAWDFQLLQNTRYQANPPTP